jgi:predicted O-linked N-acetylglucosamine transferase (SPINDLY family)
MANRQQRRAAGINAKRGMSSTGQTPHIYNAAVQPGVAPPTEEIRHIVAQFSQGRYPEAEEAARRITLRFPRHGFGWKCLGTVLKAQDRTEEALDALQKAAALLPGDVEAQSNLGVTLKDLGRLEEAEACYRRALQIKPDFAEAHNNLGVVYRELKQLEKAEACHRRALAIRPDIADAHNNLGAVLKDLGRHKEAEECYRRSLEIEPDFYMAHFNLGCALIELGRFTEVVSCFKQVLKSKPDHIDAHSNLLFTMNYEVSYTPSYILEQARKYGEMLTGKVRNKFSAWHCMPGPERLRVGLVSGDLRNHPVGFFLESVLSQIDPSLIELVAYATDSVEDGLTARVKPYFSAWKSLVGLTDEAAANLIHTDGIHILLDLSGHTAKNRLPVFAWKPAPVQASWLGYFATTGVAEMDYFLGDPYVAPDVEAGHFTETIWRLPESIQCLTPPDVSLEVGPLPALSSGHITFGSFNNLSKINKDVVSLWAKVLHAVPDSRLFLDTRQLNDPSVCDATRRRFAAHGIASDRLLLEFNSPRAKFMESYNRIDIALSPFPYPGSTTSIEGLWMGVPVIVRRGDRFLSHIGESIAHNAGLADWIAHNDDEYVAIAVEHSSNLGRLATLRAGLREKMLTSPLFDAQRFARNLENAFREMWERR